jgi:hypothetical protein
MMPPIGSQIHTDDARAPVAVAFDNRDGFAG